MIDRLTYALARVGLGALALLPLGAALALGRGVGVACYHLGVRRHVVETNLRHVFGQSRSEAELREIAAESYRQFGMSVVEVTRALVEGPESAAEWVEIDQIEALRKLQAEGGLIVCVPHAGCFDRLGSSAAAQGFEFHAMMTPLKSERFNRLLVASRERVGMHMLMGGEDSFHAMFDLLDEGKTVALLPDQNARRGVRVDFLGKPAVTFKAPAVLHLVTGAPLAVVVDRRRRDDPRRHDGVVRFVPPHPPSGDRTRDVREITQRLCDVMSAEILEAPEQYFWQHRRWGKEVSRGESGRSDAEAADA